MKIDVNNLNRHEHYVGNYRVNYWSGSGSLSITDVTNALKRGKVCECVGLYCGYGKQLDTLNVVRDVDVEYLFDKNNANAIKEKYGVSVTHTPLKSSAVYSNTVKAFKRITALPEKINKNTIIALLTNKQYKSFKVKQHLTDDYAYDASVNYGEGKDVDVDDFLKSLIEESSKGYRFWNEGGNKITVALYTFWYAEIEYSL